MELILVWDSRGISAQLLGCRTPAQCQQWTPSPKHAVTSAGYAPFNVHFPLSRKWKLNSHPSSGDFNSVNLLEYFCHL